MTISRLGNGERISSVSAFLLLIFMFFHWFGVKLSNTSSFLFAVQGGGPGKNAWEALEYIPIVLVVAIVATVAVAVLRLTNVVSKLLALINGVVAVLGFVSVILILVRIVDPPIYYVEATITSEGTVRFPIILALAAACGIAYGGYRAMREEGVSFAGLRARRIRD